MFVDLTKAFDTGAGLNCIKCQRILGVHHNDASFHKITIQFDSNTSDSFEVRRE